MKLGTVGLIARFRPLHNGSASLLDAVCSNADHVTIGIGSANKYNARNPFTADEAAEMIRLYLSRFSNYDIIQVPDFAHIPEFRDGQKWRDYVVDAYGKLDNFVTGNPYVASLLKDAYNIVNAYDVVPADKHVFVKGSMVRMAMATGQEFEKLVPREVADFLLENKLVERFQREFGLETLAGLGDSQWQRPECQDEEKVHTYEK